MPGGLARAPDSGEPLLPSRFSSTDADVRSRFDISLASERCRTTVPRRDPERDPERDPAAGAGPAGCRMPLAARSALRYRSPSAAWHRFARYRSAGRPSAAPPPPLLFRLLTGLLRDGARGPARAPIV